MGHPLEVHAGDVYTSAVYNNFEDEFYKSMSLCVSDRIGDNEFVVTRAHQDFMVDYETKSYTVTLSEGGDLILWVFSACWNATPAFYKGKKLIPISDHMYFIMLPSGYRHHVAIRHHNHRNENYV